MMLVVWRLLSTLPRLSLLARALATAVALNLASAAYAGFALASADPPPPDNTAGLAAVIVGRTAILAVVVFWEPLLNRWGGVLGRETTPPSRYSR